MILFNIKRGLKLHNWINHIGAGALRYIKKK